MDVLYLLVPLSMVAMLGVLGVFAWALQGGQFDDVEAEGQRVLLDAEGAETAARQDAAAAESPRRAG